MNGESVKYVGALVKCEQSQLDIKKILIMEYKVMIFSVDDSLFICKEADKVSREDVVRDLRKVGIYIWSDSVLDYDIVNYDVVDYYNSKYIM